MTRLHGRTQPVSLSNRTTMAAQLGGQDNVDVSPLVL